MVSSLLLELRTAWKITTVNKMNGVNIAFVNLSIQFSVAIILIVYGFMALFKKDKLTVLYVRAITKKNPSHPRYDFYKTKYESRIVRFSTKVGGFIFMVAGAVFLIYLINSIPNK
jgi:hypothetical protein